MRRPGEDPRGLFPSAAWPDPAHPQQVHLDVEVEDLEAAEREVLAHGASLLRVYADPAGHPFCLLGAAVRTA